MFWYIHRKSAELSKDKPLVRSAFIFHNNIFKAEHSEADDTTTTELSIIAETLNFVDNLVILCDNYITPKEFGIPLTHVN